MLLEPNEKFRKHIETSKHYLNCPKFWLNSNLHDMMRQGGLEYIIWFLKLYKFSKPVEKAKEWYEAYKDVKVYDFVNPNSYIDKELKDLPVRCQETHWKFEREFERSKKVWGWWEWAVGIEFDKNIHRRVAVVKN